jgi:hypothetical protein
MTNDKYVEHQKQYLEKQTDAKFSTAD